MTAHYRVTHTTRYRYEAEVTDSLGVAHLTPRRLPWQRVDGWSVDVDPEPVDVGTETDVFGNTVSQFQVSTPHRTLTVTASGTVAVTAVAPDDAALRRPWETLRPLVDTSAPGAWEATDLALPTPAVPVRQAATDLLAAACLRPGRPLGEAVLDLVGRIHADFEYDPSATTVTSRLDDVVTRRAGVCQDFAHLLLACLRGAGLAARYVSGYLATDPPEGESRVVGADASHAWVQVWLGGDDWFAVDPTNDRVVTDRHVTVAWGRDYTDVPPLKGVIFSDAAGSALDVAVDVAPVSDGHRARE